MHDVLAYSGSNDRANGRVLDDACFSCARAPAARFRAGFRIEGIES